MHQKTRGAFIAAVFAIGVGILVAGLVAMIVSAAFLHAFPAPDYLTNRVLSTQPEGDFVWRIVLMFGAVPAMMTYYLRMKMPETARFTALVAGDHRKAASDMARVLDRNIQDDEEPYKVASKPESSYGLFSGEFMRRHGLHLIGTSTTWFLLDIAFYSLNLTQKDVFPSIGLLKKGSTMNAIEEVFKISRAMFLVALFATVPGYWFTVFFIDKIGRYLIQLGGFLMMSIFMAIMGIRYSDLRGEKDKCPKDSTSDYCGGNKIAFAILSGLAFFFANFGPNSTTFIVPAELFPARFRSTCHGISAAAGKAGAIIGAFIVQGYTLDGNSKKIRKAIIGLAVVNLLGFFCSFMVPETNGRSLEEISGEDKDFGGGGAAVTDEKVKDSSTDTYHAGNSV